jgi:hypothetical protein
MRTETDTIFGGAGGSAAGAAHSGGGTGGNAYGVELNNSAGSAVSQNQGT